MRNECGQDLRANPAFGRAAFVKGWTLAGLAGATEISSRVANDLGVPELTELRPNAA